VLFNLRQQGFELFVIDGFDQVVIKAGRE
jgi:hypothetical protein